jgi:alpha-galactosidase
MVLKNLHKLIVFTLVIVLGLFSIVPVLAAKPELNNGLALTPPMGWNSWNKFGCNVTDALVRQMADAMVSSGMSAAGYKYIVIDDCWQSTTRTNGHVNLDPDFPNMKSLADYVHSKGLKFGLYSDHGTSTCAGRAGSYGHETTDAQDYATWGVDYLKYDNCNLVAGSNLQTDYTRMRDALAATGRPIVFSICAWHYESWMPSVGNLWRTTGDISNSWNGMIGLPDTNNQSASVAGPGAWNDPDMLEVGNGGMTDTEYRTHMSLWAIMAAPLISGNDLSNMTQATKDILMAPEILAVDQDALGKQGTRVWVGGSGNWLNIWSKQLSGTNVRAVALFNGTTSAADITVNWSQIGLPAGNATVRDLWARADRGTFNNSYTINVPAHGTVMLKIISGSSGGPTPTPAGPTATPGAFPVAGTYYRLISRVSGKVAEVAGFSTADGGNVQQWTSTGTSSQQWSFVSVGGGYYNVINRNSGKCLDVSGVSTADGANVQQWTCGTGANQRWQLVAVGSYYQLKAQHSGKALDVVGNGTADGVNIDQWTSNGGNNQQWQIVP